MDLEVRPEDEDILPRVPPNGWQVGCRSGDRSWLGYINESYPDQIDLVTGWVPPEYDDATAVFFGPYIEEGDTSWQWFAPDDDDPWASVLLIARNGIGDDRFAAAQPLDEETGRALSEVLSINGDELYTCGYFLGNRAWTATGTALSVELTAHEVGEPSADGSIEYSSGWDMPDLFFPHDKRWFAVVLYDFGWLYLASSEQIAEKVRARPDLIMLPCRL